MAAAGSESITRVPRRVARAGQEGRGPATSLTYAQALDEALCHGWIDGQAAPGDSATYRQRFTPRRSRSRWSARNVGIIGRLRTEGRMHPAGEAEVSAPRHDGRWDAAYGGAAFSAVPPDLAAASRANRARGDVRDPDQPEPLLDPLSYQRGQAGCRPARRRIDQFVAMLARGETVYPPEAHSLRVISPPLPGGGELGVGGRTKLYATVRSLAGEGAGAAWRPAR